MTMSYKNGVRPFIILFIFFLLKSSFVVFDANATVVRLDKGTEIKIRLVSGTKVSSDNFVKGDSLHIVLIEPVVLDDSTVVEIGAQGRAIVTESIRGGKGGKPGYIKVRFASLFPKGVFKTIDGSPILLSGEIENEGKGKKILSWIFVAGLFIRGENGEIDTDSAYTARIAETIKLRSK